MINIAESVRKKLLENPIHREIIIKFPDDDIADIGSDNIIADSFELTQSICDGDFELGGGIAGRLSVKVVNIESSLNNKRIRVYIKQKYGNGDLFPNEKLLPNETLYPGMQEATVERPLFYGTIDSSLRQKNRGVKEIIAYDDIYLLSQIKCKSWLTGYIGYTSEITLGKLIKAALGTTDIESSKINDNSINFNYSKVLSWVGSSEGLAPSRVGDILDDDITVLDLLKAYCELNAQFAVIDNLGRINPVRLFKYSSGKTEKKVLSEDIRYYADLSFEEYTTSPINLIRFYYNKNQLCDYGRSAEKQSWYVSKNDICKCLDDIGEIITAFNDNNGANFIFHDLYSYRPFTADVFARWWLEPGDKVAIRTGYDDTETVESFVLSRTLKGINGMRCIIKATGTEYLGKDEITSG